MLLTNNKGALACEQALQGALAAGRKKKESLQLRYLSGIWISALKKSMQNADWWRWHA